MRHGTRGCQHHGSSYPHSPWSEWRVVVLLHGWWQAAGHCSFRTTATATIYDLLHAKLLLHCCGLTKLSSYPHHPCHL